MKILIKVWCLLFSNSWCSYMCCCNVQWYCYLLFVLLWCAQMLCVVRFVPVTWFSTPSAVYVCLMLKTLVVFIVSNIRSGNCYVWLLPSVEISVWLAAQHFCVVMAAMLVTVDELDTLVSVELLAVKKAKWATVCDMFTVKLQLLIIVLQCTCT